MSPSTAFFKRDIVEVKSFSEILETLDGEGKLDGLPFMPEMLPFCGKRLRIQRWANRTCVVGQGIRAMRDAVFLEGARCDGAAHGECQRGCLLFWKTAWLRRVDPVRPAIAASVHAVAPPALSKARLMAPERNGRYYCQSTELLGATTPISRWDLRPYLREVLRGDLSMRKLLGLMWGTLLKRMRLAREPRLAGSGKGQHTERLDLRPGEWVLVKSAAEISTTLTEKGSHRGLRFQPTMHPAMGGTFQVAFPVKRIILEPDGRMVKLDNTVALEGVVCSGKCVAYCPRGEFLFWRETWLSRLRSNET